jgi:hypothetical protein
MYGIPDNTDWSFLVGKELIQVCIGLHDVSLRFHEDVSIGIRSDFEHKPVAYSVASTPGLTEKAVTLVSLLGSKIVKATTHGPKTLVLSFSNTEYLKIYDNSDSYESFEVSGPGVEIIV